MFCQGALDRCREMYYKGGDRGGVVSEEIASVTITLDGHTFKDPEVYGYFELKGVEKYDWIEDGMVGKYNDQEFIISTVRHDRKQDRVKLVVRSKNDEQDEKS